MIGDDQKSGGEKMIGRTLYDVTQLLESADRADERVRRVLELLCTLVPYEQCALLEARLGHEERVVLVPEPSAGERVVVTRALVDIFGQLVDTDGRICVVPSRPEEARLAVPLVGLDEVMGILLVRSSVTEYGEDHLRALSVIAAKLAAYITIRGTNADLADLARGSEGCLEGLTAGAKREVSYIKTIAHDRYFHGFRNPVRRGALSACRPIKP